MGRNAGTWTARAVGTVTIDLSLNHDSRHNQGIMKHTKEAVKLLVQIQIEGKKKEAENERFRRFWKNSDHSDEELRRIASRIESEIDCTQCANCCRVPVVTVEEHEISRLAHYLNISPATVIAEYTDEDEGCHVLRQTKDGCVFLKNNLCTVYDARPDQCEGFPYLSKGEGEIVSHSYALMDRVCYCPIVYHSVEAFKEALSFPRSTKRK